MTFKNFANDSFIFECCVSWIKIFGLFEVNLEVVSATEEAGFRRSYRVPNMLIKDRSVMGVPLPIESFLQPSGQELDGACIGSDGFSDVSNVETNSATEKSPAPKSLPKSNVRKTRQAKKNDIDIETQPNISSGIRLPEDRSDFGNASQSLQSSLRMNLRGKIKTMQSKRSKQSKRKSAPTSKVRRSKATKSPTGCMERNPLHDILNMVANSSVEANSSLDSSFSNSVAEFNSSISKSFRGQSADSSTLESSTNSTSANNLNMRNDVSVVDDVPDYHSSFDENVDPDDSPAVDPPAKRKRLSKVKREYELVQEFANAADCKEFMKSEKAWSIATTNETVQGKKVLYRCNKNKLRGRQCEAAIQVLYAVERDSVFLYKASNNHTCEEHPRLYSPMDDNTKQFITDLFAKGIRKRKCIQTNLIDAKIQMPTKTQLNSFIKELRREAFGTPKMTLGELEALVLQHTALPEEDDEPFVVSHTINYETEDFKIVISSKRLLRNVIGVNLVSADTTYKMVWQGFPVDPVDRHFHLFATMVSKNERNDDFEFLFSTLKSAAANLFQYDFTPKILISDAADAIHIGFRKVFGVDVMILMCWFHMKKAVKSICLPW